MIYLALTSSLLASTFNVANVNELRQAFADAGAGDEIVLADGTYAYSQNLKLQNKSGSSSSRLIIRPADGAHPVLNQTSNSNNVWEIENSSYVTVRGIELMGGSLGLRLKNSNFITVEDCIVHDVPGTAITANYPGETYEGLRFSRNEVYNTHDTAEAFYLGCHTGNCVVHDSIIENNYIHDIVDAEPGYGSAIQIKNGSYNNIVRDNVIHDVAGPCLLLYGISSDPACYGETRDSSCDKGRNVLERNFCWGSGDNGIQITADVTVRNNVVLRSGSVGIRAQQGPAGNPGRIDLVNNTVIGATTSVLRIDNPTAPVNVSNNALYGDQILSGSTSSASQISWSHNIGAGTNAGLVATTGVIADDFVSVTLTSGLNVYPKAGSHLIGAGDAAAQPADDFNTSTRTGSADVGAYVFAASGNPGWSIGESFKTFPTGGGPTEPGTDPGTNPGDGSGNGNGNGNGDGDGQGATDSEDNGGCTGAGAPSLLALAAFAMTRRIARSRLSLAGRVRKVRAN